MEAENQLVFCAVANPNREVSPCQLAHAASAMSQVVLRDFDYSVPLSFFTSWLSTLSITPLDWGCPPMESFARVMM